MVVAVDDVPEEGLDQPLRMDKLTNEVRKPERLVLQKGLVIQVRWLYEPPTYDPTPPLSGDLQTPQGYSGCSRRLRSGKRRPARGSHRGGGVLKQRAKVWLSTHIFVGICHPTPGFFLGQLHGPASIESNAFSSVAFRFVSELPPWRPFNASLDDSQRRAVGLALSAKDIALVHGPPGEGTVSCPRLYVKMKVRTKTVTPPRKHPSADPAPMPVDLGLYKRATAIRRRPLLLPVLLQLSDVQPV